MLSPNQLQPDDVRALREIRQWFRTNKHTANLPNQPPARRTKFPAQATRPDWVTINVINKSGYDLAKWCPVSLLDLAAGETYATFPDTRLWNVGLGSNDAENPVHIVLAQPLAPNEKGIGVVKGVVPCRFTNVTKASAPYFIKPKVAIPDTSRMVDWEAASAYGGNSVLRWAGQVPGAGTPVTWGLVDLNHGYVGDAAAPGHGELVQGPSYGGMVSVPASTMTTGDPQYTAKIPVALTNPIYFSSTANGWAARKKISGTIAWSAMIKPCYPGIQILPLHVTFPNVRVQYQCWTSFTMGLGRFTDSVTPGPRPALIFDEFFPQSCAPETYTMVGYGHNDPFGRGTQGQLRTYSGTTPFSLNAGEVLCFHARTMAGRVSGYEDTYPIEPGYVKIKYGVSINGFELYGSIPTPPPVDDPQIPR